MIVNGWWLGVPPWLRKAPFIVHGHQWFITLSYAQLWTQLRRCTSRTHWEDAEGYEGCSLGNLLIAASDSLVWYFKSEIFWDWLLVHDVFFPFFLWAQSVAWELGAQNAIQFFFQSSSAHWSPFWDESVYDHGQSCLPNISLHCF